ncbi:MAG: CBS domain-containing protein [Actinomycetota bacterium]|nr:CBS domain-containing protein [Actinomycetota bacterium]
MVGQPVDGPRTQRAALIDVAETEPTAEVHLDAEELQLMLVREIMSKPVVTVRTSTTIAETAQLLAGGGFTAVPVLDDDDQLVGIVSEADLLRSPLRPDPRRQPDPRPDRVDPAPRFAADVMSTMVESLTPGADVADAARIMVDDRIRTLPVVDGQRVVGIITRRDLLQFAT